MYKLIAMLSLALLTCSAAGATESITTDAEWWSSTTDKGTVMLGATDAYQWGWRRGQKWRGDSDYKTTLGALAAADLAPTQRIRFFKYLLKTEDAVFNDQVSNEPSFSNKPMQAFIDGVDYFYSNHPDAHDVTFGNVLACVANNPVKSCNELAKTKF